MERFRPCDSERNCRVHWQAGNRDYSPSKDFGVHLRDLALQFGLHSCQNQSDPDGIPGFDRQPILSVSSSVSGVLSAPKSLILKVWPPSFKIPFSSVAAVAVSIWHSTHLSSVAMPIFFSRKECSLPRDSDSHCQRCRPCPSNTAFCHFS